MPHPPEVLVFGAGPVGLTVGGWLAPHTAHLTFLDKPDVVSALKKNGLNLYEQNQKKNTVRYYVKAVDDLGDTPPPDLIFLCVKNYSLAPVSELLVKHFGDTPLVVGFQNGAENQRVLPRYFKKVIFGVVCYNAWLDAPGVAGYQKKGPLVLGTPTGDLRAECRSVAALLGQGVETIVTDHLLDAVYSKMIINLTNSLTTLVGHGFKPISDTSVFQTLLSNLTWEGVQIVKAAGLKECKLGGMPSWTLIQAAANLPNWVTKPVFDKNVAKMVVSSMAQDVLQRGQTQSELDTINAPLLALADYHGVAAPFNRAVYDLCRERFAAKHFTPMDVKEVYAAVERHMKEHPAA